ncbi:MAG: gliding motility-associated C-terminal domain-containing protein, partial [Bacteroidetes bacterium]|nr:gliding motility-associated C-terminal domain-containing protein [Bacteroidota bacterium]
CGPHAVNLSASGAQTYSWSPATGLNNANIANPLFTGTSTQTYTITGTGANSCSAKDTITITVNAVPLVSATGPVSICRNDVLQLSGSSNAQVTHWSPAASVSNANILNPNFIDTVSQQMIITGTNTSTGCFASDTINVTVKPLPLVRTIEDTTTCTTNSITLFTTGAQTYTWTPATGLSNTNSSSPVFSGNGVHTYYVTGTGANGCEAIDSVTIDIEPKPVFVAPTNRSICLHESVQLDGNNGPVYDYTWSPAIHLNNPTSMTPVADPITTTVYSLLVHDNTCKYDSTFAVTVTVLPVPTVTAASSNDMSCAIPQSQLTASGAIHYEWTPATYLTDPFISNPIASPYNTTQYIVIGSNQFGCKDADTVTVKVTGSKYFGFAIPNAFTPNGDNLNDCFGVNYWGETKNFHLMVYNRWGEKVFETHNVSDCWDGTYKGNPCEIGNYVYYLTGETLCGKVNRKGNLVLFR